MENQIVGIFGIACCMYGALDNGSVQLRHGVKVDELINNLKTLFDNGLWLLQKGLSAIVPLYQHLMDTVCCDKGDPFIGADVIGIDKLYTGIFFLFCFYLFMNVFIDVVSLEEQQ